MIQPRHHWMLSTTQAIDGIYSPRSTTWPRHTACLLTGYHTRPCSIPNSSFFLFWISLDAILNPSLPYLTWTMLMSYLITFYHFFKSLTKLLAKEREDESKVACHPCSISFCHPCVLVCLYLCILVYLESKCSSSLRDMPFSYLFCLVAEDEGYACSIIQGVLWKPLPILMYWVCFISPHFEYPLMNWIQRLLSHASSAFLFLSCLSLRV